MNPSIIRIRSGGQSGVDRAALDFARKNEAGAMRVYIDFDDVICETAKHFCCIAKELFDIDLPYQEVQFFNSLKRSGWIGAEDTICRSWRK